LIYFDAILTLIIPHLYFMVNIGGVLEFNSPFCPIWLLLFIEKG